MQQIGGTLGIAVLGALVVSGAYVSLFLIAAGMMLSVAPIAWLCLGHGGPKADERI